LPVTFNVARPGAIRRKERQKKGKKSFVPSGDTKLGEKGKKSPNGTLRGRGTIINTDRQEKEKK